MNCTEFEQRLDELLDDRAPLETPELQRHAASCDECRALWQQSQRLRSAVEDWRRSVPDVILADGVLNRLAAFPRPGANSPQMPKGAATAGRKALGRYPAAGPNIVATVAAVLLLMVAWPAIERLQPTEPQPLNRLDATQGEPAAAVSRGLASRTGPSNETAVPLTALVNDAGTAYAGLAYETAAAVRDGVALVAPRALIASSSAGDGSESSASPASTVEWELSPFGRNLGGAFHFLLDVVPDEAAPAI